MSPADGLTFNPFDPAQTHDMWDLARRFRQERPVAHLDGGFVFVSRYEDVRTVLRNNVVFASAGGFRPTGVSVPLEDRNLGEIDPPLHAPIRRLALHAASGSGVVESLRAFTREQCDTMFSSLLSHGGGDLIGELSLPLTNRVIGALLGVPPDEANWMALTGEEVMNSTLAVTNETERGVGYAGAFPEFTAYVDELVRRGSQDPDTGGVIARIVAGATDQGDLSVEIIRMVMINLLLGGTATTRDHLGNLFHQLVVEPELHERIAADPALVDTAVEEGLRLAPPVLFVIRTTTEDTEVAGVSVNAGDRVIAGIAAGNRDEEVFESPDQFSLDRVDPAPHLSFGYGPHLCVGASLARMELQEALKSFLDLVEPGQLRMADGFELSFMPQPFLFGPTSVDVTVTA